MDPGKLARDETGREGEARQGLGPYPISSPPLPLELASRTRTGLSKGCQWAVGGLPEARHCHCVCRRRGERESGGGGCEREFRLIKDEELVL